MLFMMTWLACWCGFIWSDCWTMAFISRCIQMSHRIGPIIWPNTRINFQKAGEKMTGARRELKKWIRFFNYNFLTHFLTDSNLFYYMANMSVDSEPLNILEWPAEEFLLLLILLLRQLSWVTMATRHCFYKRKHLIRFLKAQIIPELLS